MSGWAAWLPQITGYGFAGGALVASNGAFLAASPGYQMTAAECMDIVKKFGNPALFNSSPNTFAGQKYLALRCNDQVAEFKSGDKGISSFRTKKGTVVICFYNGSSAVQNPSQAGGVATKVQAVFDNSGI